MLLAMSRHVTDDGGEGLIIRKPKSKYVKGRTSLLYKFKVNINEISCHLNRL